MLARRLTFVFTLIPATLQDLLLAAVVEDCVNAVDVDVNTGSPALFTRISGRVTTPATAASHRRAASRNSNSAARPNSAMAAAFAKLKNQAAVSESQLAYETADDRLGLASAP